ncbi:MAG: hypothetical protein HY958_02800 [Bacteroidia bacterium]|nr:hypothetical protein [Bacteroidia bacterium]
MKKHTHIKNLLFHIRLRISYLKFLILILSVFFAGCKSNTFDIDVSNIKAEVKIHRFEKDLFAIKLDSIADYVPKLSKKYGAFFDLYSNKIITIGSPYQRSYPEYLKGFITDYTINEVYRKCNEVFPDVDELEKKLTMAFKHYKYYFPNKTVPAIYTYISGFNQSVVTAENILGIGLDKYLGKNCDFYKRLVLPMYIRVKMHKAKIPSDCMVAWAQAEFPFSAESDNLINTIIYQGKVMYFADAMLPTEHDTLKMGFTEKQLKWCEKNESEMWTYLVEKKQLFINDFLSIKKYTDEGPFTSGFTQKSPGRACVWLGRQIVCAYMKNNPNVTIAELMNDNDYQKILAKAKYKP